MAIRTNKRRTFKSEQDFLAFGRVYLSEAFPNPDREGCPPDEMLRLLANRSTGSDISIIDHVICCSPCFNGYMAHLGRLRAELLQARRIRRVSRVIRSLVIVGVLMATVAIYLFVKRRQSEPIVRVGQPVTHHVTASYVPVLIDLSNASPVRGTETEANRPQMIPSSPLTDLSLRLPLGSEDREYSVMLSTNQRIVWSNSAQAHLENGQMFLHMLADFSHVPAGNYDLVIVSRGARLSAPVLVKSTWSRKMP
jgi:hypothetical protein